MVKVSEGRWQLTPDTVIDWAVEVVKTDTSNDRVYAVTTSKPLNHRGDTLNTPTLTHTIDSPAEGIVHLTSTHWFGHRSLEIGPNFDLFPDVKPAPSKVAINQSDGFTSLSAGNLTATLDTRPKSFNIDFTDSSDTLRLTGLGFRSVGFVKVATNHANSQRFDTDPSKGKTYVTYQFDLDVNEKVYGFGERFTPFVKNGQSIDVWNEDGGTASELAYKNVPFYLSSKGYGVFVPSAGRVQYEVQSEHTTRLNITLAGEQLSAYVIYGPSPKQVLEKYTLLTGRPPLPPNYSFGLWLSTSFTTSYDWSTVLSFVNGMEDRGIKVSVFHYDCFWMKRFQWCDFEFDRDYFPDPAADLKALHDRGVKVCVWINPYIAQESKLFNEGKQHGYFIKRGDGSVWQTDFWQAGQAFVDFTNPSAVAWYQSKLARLIDHGVDTFKTDFGERIPHGDAVYFDGSDPVRMHNYYTCLYNQATFEILAKKLGKENALLFARSATAGGQRFPVHWGGDPESTFGAMAESLRGGLSLALTGFGFWAHDIGGFEGQSPDPAVYKRWIQFGLLSSHSRLHGSSSYRVPWIVDSSGEAEKVLAKFVKFKQSLAPYIISQALNAHHTGVSVLRALFVEIPEDPVNWTVDTQYFFGSEILVAPVFHSHKVTYYVPAGKWYGLIDNKIRQGGQYLTETHDFFSLPVLLRPGGVVVFGGTDSDGFDYEYADGFTVVINAADAIDKTVDIADYKNVKGPSKVLIKVTASAVSLIGSNVNIEIVAGKVKQDWKIKLVGADVAKSVVIDDSKNVQAVVADDEVVVHVSPGAKKVQFQRN
ncbi:glycosyl hydrolases family 31-domain-containing protein [Lipomyces japonicus]|uniref:glycosyl hydrolases family 31-domain-containing protein n=1 Tax=Lipomyces japonicus TaxID=56871 RepID=UPI0034CD2A1A